MTATLVIDDRQQRALLAKFTQQKVDKVLQSAARAGANAMADVVRGAAPVGVSRRPSQFYRRQGLGHGTFLGSIKARRIRKRGLNSQTIGFVVGPAGKFGFTRHWITGGTRPHLIRRGRGGRIQHPGSKGNPFIERVAAEASRAAVAKSEAILTRHAKV